MSKSHKKIKFYEDYDEKPHHSFKKHKNLVDKKQSKRLDREINNALRSKNLRSLYQDI